MADKLTFSLVSPERELFHGDVDQVVVPGAEGEFGVLPAHAPVMAVVKPGALRILNDGAERRVFVNGGFADVTPAGLTVIAEDAVDLTNYDPALIESELKDARDDLNDAKTESARAAAERKIARLEAMRAALAR
jgi:F-type H+-transporting ATPase subunit epsilon